MPGDHQPTPKVGGVGICVSGGGLRAASFGLGALQALQARRGYLRGGNAARYLSAVSGGSYIAGAYTLLNCGDRVRPAGRPEGSVGSVPRSGSDSPFGPGSREAEHLRRHCRYALEEGGARMSLVLAGLMILNLLAVAAIVCFAGVYLGEIAVASGVILPHALDSWDGSAALQWPLAIAAAVSISYVVHAIGLGAVGPHRGRGAAVAFGLAVIVAVVGAAPLVSRLCTVPFLRSPAWMINNWAALAIGLGSLILATVVVALLARRYRHVAFLQRLGRFGTSLLTLRLVQAVGLLTVSWLAVLVYGEYLHSDSSALWPLGFVLALMAPAVITGVIDRASPHLVYRDLLVRCFSVIRDGEEVRKPEDPRAVPLSALAPPASGSADSFPELLVCAAVNISDVGATPAGSNALSVVFTPWEMVIPGIPEASLRTDDLERCERPTRLGGGWGPAVNLSSVVAMTGAALSPAMGKRTRNDLRALFAILNIRLGVWLPNPLDPEVRKGITTQARRIKPGVFGLVREMFGFHTAHSNEIYVTDGGHYDNLGLVELLRRKCGEIWCIDASGDRPGRASALSEAILTAAGELGARVEIDLDRFARAAGTSFASPEVKETHATGTVVYADGSEGTITVVKLGVAAETPSALREYRRGDRRFPYHSTVNQVYRADRFDAYRALGWASMDRALS